MDNDIQTVLELLRDEAAEAGDLEQVELCARAIAGDQEAIAACAKVINSNPRRAG